MITALTSYGAMANRGEQRKMWIAVGGFGFAIIAIEILVGYANPVSWIFLSVSLIVVIVAIVKYCLLARRGHFFQD